MRPAAVGDEGVGAARRDAVDAEIVLVAKEDGPRTRLVTTRSAFPVGLRRTGPRRVHLVGTGAWPLGGDRVRILIEVWTRAELEVAAVAANVALPGRHGGPSYTDVQVRVACGGWLRLDLGSTIVAEAADHRSTISVELEGRGGIALREFVVRGREGELGGRTHQQLDVTRAGVALVRESTTRPSPRAPGFTDGGAKAVGSVLQIDGTTGTEVVAEHLEAPHARGALFELEGGGWRATAVGNDVAVVDQWLTARWTDTALPRCHTTGIQR